MKAEKSDYKNMRFYYSLHKSLSIELALQLILLRCKIFLFPILNDSLTFIII